VQELEQVQRERDEMANQLAAIRTSDRRKVLENVLAIELLLYSGVGSETQTCYGLGKHAGREHCSAALKLFSESVNYMYTVC